MLLDHTTIQVVRLKIPTISNFDHGGEDSKGPSGDVMIQGGWGAFETARFATSLSVSAGQDSLCPGPHVASIPMPPICGPTPRFNNSELLMSRLLNLRPTSWAVKVSDIRDMLMIAIIATVLGFFYNRSETVVPKLRTLEHRLCPTTACSHQARLRVRGLQKLCDGLSCDLKGSG